MYCRHCGKQIPDESQYCSICGGEQFESKKENSFNPKAILCFFVSILAEVFVIAGVFMKLVNIEFHISQDMWGDYSVKKNIINFGIFDILGKSEFFRYLTSLSESFNEIYSNLVILAVLIIAVAIVCVIYMIVYLSRYSYSYSNKKASVFGTNFERYSAIPSILMLILMLVILGFSSSCLKEINEYVSVQPAIGSILQFICALIHLVVNIISKDCRSECRSSNIKPL